LDDAFGCWEEDAKGLVSPISPDLVKGLTAYNAKLSLLQRLVLMVSHRLKVSVKSIDVRVVLDWR
jgi:hypothetical protein